MHLLIKTLSRLPFFVHYTLAGCAYFLLYYVARYRRKVVRRNLAGAFPELSTAELVALEKRFYRWFCDSAAEAMKGLTMTAAELEKRVVFENPELLAPYLEREESLVLLTIHQCNPEWVTQAMGNFLPCPMTGLYKPLHSKLMDELIFEARSRYGKPVPVKNTAREILRLRKSFRAMILAADQSPISREKRYWAPFFGRPAPFYFGPQSIAEATGKPLIFMHNRRLRRGYYSIRFEILAEPPYQKGGTELLDRYIAVCERSIREQPETWWWSNKKWKSPKPGELEAAGLGDN